MALGETAVTSAPWTPPVAFCTCSTASGPTVDGKIRAQLFRKLQLVVINIGGNDMHAHGLGILHGHMTKPANARYDHPFAGPHFGFLETLVDGDTGAEHGCSGTEFQIVGKSANEFRIGKPVFRKAAIDGITRVLLTWAKSFPAGTARNAASAGGVKPRRAGAVAFLDAGHASADLGDVADAFMAGDEWWIGFDRPIARCGVQVRVANAGRLVIDENFTRAGIRYRHFLDGQRFAKCADNRGLHCFSHDILPNLCSPEILDGEAETTGDGASRN